MQNLLLAPSVRDEYHVAWYKNFTAIPVIKNDPKESNPEVQIRVPYLRSVALSTSLPTTSTGIFSNVCPFCDRERKKLKKMIRLSCGRLLNTQCN